MKQRLASNSSKPYICAIVPTTWHFMTHAACHCFTPSAVSSHSPYLCTGPEIGWYKLFCKQKDEQKVMELFPQLLMKQKWTANSLIPKYSFHHRKCIEFLEPITFPDVELSAQRTLPLQPWGPPCLAIFFRWEKSRCFSLSFEPQDLKVSVVCGKLRLLKVRRGILNCEHAEEYLGKIPVLCRHMQ